MIERSLFLIYTVLLSACISKPLVTVQQLKLNQDSKSCLTWMEQLDRRILDNAVADAQNHRVPGFPYLRSNRLLATLSRNATGQNKKNWINLMQ